MADDWRILEKPSNSYSNWAQESGSLFAMPVWSNALVALGAEPMFAWNPGYGVGALIAHFRRGPLHIGVLGIPVAGEYWDKMDPAGFAYNVMHIGKLARLDLLRVSRSMAQHNDSGAISARPEVWIDDFLQWKPAMSKRLRKDLAFAHRSNPRLAIVDHCADPIACFQLYAATISQRGGRLRYTERYYKNLTGIAKRTDRLRIFSAFDADQSMRGFAVLALHGSVGYYLHSGVDAKGKREGVTDLLLEAIVIAAREAGCTRLTLMASPWEQPGLVRFKRKWGNRQGLSSSYDFAFGVVGRCGRLLSGWMARSDRHEAMIWSDAGACRPGAAE